jgi:hypothetical protein
MEISRLYVEAISAATKYRNQMPLPLSPGAPIFLGSDVTTFLHKYESLAAFTSTDPTSSDAVTMFPYYCVDASNVRDTVVMMRGYVELDWAARKKEIGDAFHYTDSQPDSVVYTRQYLEYLCAEFVGHDNTESLKSFLRTYDHISGVVTKHGMMVEYERTEILLRALPKRLRRKAISELGFNPIEPRTFEYGKLNGWIAARIVAAGALPIFDFLAAAAPPVITLPALLASTSSTAPTRTVAFPISSTPETPMTHTTFLALRICPASTASPTSIASPAPLAPTA